MLVCVLFLTACSGAAAAGNTLLATQEGNPYPTATLTATIEPTATIDYMQTAIVAKATSDEAMRINVQVTAEQDRRNFIQAQWTVEAEAMTMQSDQFTATAYATSVPATQTAQAISNTIRGTEMAMTITAPTQIIAMKNAQVYTEFADELQATELVLQLVIATFILGLALFLIAAAVIRLFEAFRKTEDHFAGQRTEEATPIPFVPAPGSESEKGVIKLVRAEVPCNVDQLLVLADGVVNSGRTLAFNHWEGTPVHKSLKELRAFFVQHHFARVMMGKGGELGVEVLGEEFLQDCLAYKSPPLPYVCAE